MEGKYVMNDAERELVDALRSGKYTQITGMLRYMDGFCCLGVACELNNPNGWYQNMKSQAIYFLSGDNHEEKDNQVLPNEVRKLLYWADASGSTHIKDRGEHIQQLSALNDNGFNFSQIADIIEAGLVLHLDNE